MVLLTGIGTTGTDGTVAFSLSNARKGCYSTDVTDVTAADLNWDGLPPDSLRTTSSAERPSSIRFRAPWPRWGLVMAWVETAPTFDLT